MRGEEAARIFGKIVDDVMNTPNDVLQKRLEEAETKKNVMQYKMAIVVRADVPMSPAKMAVQVAHAAVGCVMSLNFDDDSKAWFIEGQKKIILRVPDLESLKKVEVKADEHELPNYLVEDFGLTELDPGTVTCLGIGPASNEQMKPVTGRLRLW